MRPDLELEELVATEVRRLESQPIALRLGTAFFSRGTRIFIRVARVACGVGLLVGAGVIFAYGAAALTTAFASLTLAALALLVVCAGGAILLIGVAFAIAFGPAPAIDVEGRARVIVAQRRKLHDEQIVLTKLQERGLAQLTGRVGRFAVLFDPHFAKARPGMWSLILLACVLALVALGVACSR